MPNTKPLFNATGNHLHVHGEPAMPNAVSATRSFGIHSGLQVMSRVEGKSTKEPEVVLFTADQPFTFDWRMSSAVARALAANILQACDTADRVAAHRETAKSHKGSK